MKRRVFSQLISTWGMAAFISVGQLLSTRLQANEVSKMSQKKVKTAVIYLSRSGNTRLIAMQLQRELGCDLFELQPAQPYPKDYREMVEHNRQDLELGVLTALKETIDVSQYTTLYLGFPIWSGTMPPIVRSFLKTHNLDGKTIFPFITHGRYSKGDSLEVLNSLAPKSQIQEHLEQECDQERDTMEMVEQWIQV